MDIHLAVPGRMLVRHELWLSHDLGLSNAQQKLKLD
jgi:hypothetical protein